MLQGRAGERGRGASIRWRAAAVLTGVALLTGTVAGCGTARGSVDAVSSAGGTAPATATAASSPATAVRAHPSRRVKQALLQPRDLPDRFSREPDPASTQPSTMHSDRADCTTALAGVNSAAAPGSVLAETADRASAYYTTGGHEPTLSHSVARFPSARRAALAFARLTSLPVTCRHWKETDGHGTTVTTTVTAQRSPTDPDEEAFTIRVVATGGVSADVRVQVAVARRGRMLGLLARTGGAGHATAASSLLARVSARL